MRQATLDLEAELEQNGHPPSLAAQYHLDTPLDFKGLGLRERESIERCAASARTKRVNQTLLTWRQCAWKSLSIRTATMIAHLTWQANALAKWKSNARKLGLETTRLGAHTMHILHARHSALRKSLERLLMQACLCARAQLLRARAARSYKRLSYTRWRNMSHSQTAYFRILDCAYIRAADKEQEKKKLALHNWMMTTSAQIAWLRVTIVVQSVATRKAERNVFRILKQYSDNRALSSSMTFRYRMQEQAHVMHTWSKQCVLTQASAPLGFSSGKDSVVDCTMTSLRDAFQRYVHDIKLIDMS